MTHFLAKAFWLVAEPGNLLLILLVLGAVATVFGRRWFGRILIGIATVGFLAVATLPVAGWLMAPLEDRFPQPVLPAKVDGIVVLGGALEERTTAARGRPHLNRYAERMTEFVRLSRRYPDARLVFTGGTAALLGTPMTEAEVAKLLLDDLGVDLRRVTFESHSRNTWENARFAREMVQPRPGEIWLMVTSAFHMPRAVLCFRAVGWDVVPVPVDYYTTGKSDVGIGFNLDDNLSLMGQAAHEWIGLAAYRILGRTDRLMP